LPRKPDCLIKAGRFFRCVSDNRMRVVCLTSTVELDPDIHGYPTVPSPRRGF
jgi:hypothetical protein